MIEFSLRPQFWLVSSNLCKHFSGLSGRCLLVVKQPHLVPGNSFLKRAEPDPDVIYNIEVGMGEENSAKIALASLLTGGPGCRGSALMVSMASSKNVHKYLFNCGEGLRRHASMSRRYREVSLHLNGLQNIFITHNRWDNMAGLLGTFLGLQESSKRSQTEGPKGGKNKVQEKVSLYGPDIIQNIFGMVGKVQQYSNHLKVEKCNGEYQDRLISISPVIFYDSEPRSRSPMSPKKFRSTDSESSDSDTELPDRDCSYAYICQPKPQRPSIVLTKVVEAGITLGPMVGQLQRGQSVTLADGRVVTPEMVTKPIQRDNRPFLVVDCPSLTFLPSLTSNPDLEKYMTSDLDKTLMLMVHMTPAEVYHSPGYQDWIKRFPECTNHLVMNDSAWEMDMKRMREHQAYLQLVNKRLFPLPAVTETDDDKVLPQITQVKPNETAPELGDEQKKAEEEEDLQVIPVQGQTVKACPGLVFFYRGATPKFQIYKDPSLADEIAEVQDRPHVIKEVNKATQTIKQMKNEETRSYPKVVFLGTASAEPNSIRCQSCILVQLSKHTTMLLDCGEDSYGQLYRFYGKKKTSQVLQKLRAIFISHLHLDHFIGVFTIIQERKKVFEEKGLPYQPVILLSNIQFRRWLSFFETQMEPLKHLYQVYHHQDRTEVTDKLRLSHVTLDQVKYRLGLQQYKPVEVIHCANAYGMTFTHNNGTKVTYSGDTIPCDKLVAAGKNSDILIHEATHEDALSHLAKTAKHSTFSGAIEVGRKMSAKHIILTHFSQRYCYMLPLDEVELPPNVGIAFDNMIVEPKTLSHLPVVIPALTAIFEDKLKPHKLKQVKRKQQENIEHEQEIKKVKRES